MTPQAFSVRMNRIADGIPISLNAEKKQVAKAVLRRVVHDTPVDTSLHGSLWQVKNGVPGRLIYPAFFVGKAGSTRDASFETAIRKGEAVIDMAKPGQSIYISNTGPAIHRLNEGYSAQAPARFVEKGIGSAIKLLRTIKVLKRAA